MKEILLCAINNIESGTCPEDCKFCTQSTKYKAKIQRYKKKNIDMIVEEAKIAKKNKANGYCLVTAGVGLNDERIEFVCKATHAIKKEINNLNIIACNGIASTEQLKELKKAGVNKYNHNLESSREYYHNICSTHNWEERYQTCLNVHQANLKLCTGGIFGLGESMIDRTSMLNSIKDLKPVSAPINFFHPNEALPINQNILSADEALKLVSYSKNILGNDITLMIAGGRELILGSKQYEIFNYGANAMIIGDYLTTQGNETSNELKILEKLNIKIADFKQVG